MININLKNKKKIYISKRKYIRISNLKKKIYFNKEYILSWWGTYPPPYCCSRHPFAVGPIERGYSLRKRRQACSSLNDLKNNALLDDGQLTYLCLRTLTLLLNLIWPSRPPCGRRLSVRRRDRLWPPRRNKNGGLADCWNVPFPETTAAWEPHSAAFLKRVARAVAARESASVALLEAQLLQELCITARSFHARTVLHRRAELSTATSWSVADRCWCWSSELKFRGRYIYYEWNCCFLK